MSVLVSRLAEWIADQRWYATKGRQPRIRVIGALEGVVPAGHPYAEGATVVSYLLIDEAHEKPVLYQVPIVHRDAPLEGGEAFLIGEVDGRHLYDGPHDPTYAASLLHQITHALDTSGEGATASGHKLLDPGVRVDSRVLRGEQSNTSIIYDVEGGPVPHVIAKVFRVLHHGENPDVTTQAALTSGGSRRVPTSFGSLTATWPDPGRESGTATGHLAFVQEFLPGLEDAWRVALRAAEAGEDFSEQAFELGRTVAEVHQVLAETLETVEAGPDEIAGALESMRRRVRIASAEAPAVAPFGERILALYDRTAEVEWPRLQRIHGDLHLGQALYSPERGWVLLDFEGEPLRPMPERSRPDVTLRDVAGMLRSFDYVAGSLAHNDPPVDASAWASTARRSFVDGYIAASGTDVRAQRALLDAFEIDKAVYEAVYEARNRPDWVSIPTSAVERLVARSAPPVAE